MADYFANSANASEWQASTAYVSGDRVVPTIAYGTAAAKKYVFECTTGGTSHSSQPTWGTTPDGTTADNDVVWTCREATTRANASRYVNYLLNNRVAAGDYIWIDNSHVEAYAGALTLTGAGTPASLVRLISCDFATDTPTVSNYSIGATLNATSTSLVTITGAWYAYGITLQAGTSGTNAYITQFGITSGRIQIYDNCRFELPSTGAGNNAIWLGTDTGGNITTTIFKDTVVKFGATGQRFITRHPLFHWYSTTEGASAVDSSGSAPTTLFTGNSGGFMGLIEGVDLSHVSGNLADLSSRNLVFFGCKLHASVVLQITGSPTAVTKEPLVSMYSSDSSTSTIRFEERLRAGSIKQDTTVVRTGGAEHNGTAFSWLLTPTSDVGYFTPLVTSRIIAPVTTTGSKTITVEVLVDHTADLTDAEIWAELVHYDSASNTLVSVPNDSIALPDTTPTDQPAGVGTGSWTTTGVTNPRSQKVAVTATFDLTGVYYVRVFLATQKTVRVCPKAVVT